MKFKTALDRKKISSYVDRYLFMCEECKEKPIGYSEREFWGFPKYKHEIKRLELKSYLLQTKGVK